MLAATQFRRPADTTDLARRLQRRLSAYALAQCAVCQDTERLSAMAEKMQAGFSLIDEERRELAEIQIRLFDARQLLETEG